MDDMDKLIDELGIKARVASRILSAASSEQKREALLAGAENLSSSRTLLKRANDEDMAFGRARSLTEAQLDRLYLNDERIDGMIDSVGRIANFSDPVGRVLREWDGENGLHFEKVAVPIGVIGVIYESRPNVTCDAASLCFKSGNAVILRCGSESFHSATAITFCLRAGLEQAGMPIDSVQLLPSRDRAAVGALLSCAEHIDVIVPRGGKSLISRVQSESRIPIFAHLEGLCHTYIDVLGDMEKSERVVLNAKLRRVGVCGATETLLVHESYSVASLGVIIESLREGGCEVRGCDRVRALFSDVGVASEEDWHTEYLDKILSVRIVADVGEAIRHINYYGSHHTDAILTEDKVTAERFMAGVDSAIILHNASTQYADGGEFGMGGELGISTGRLHARGPIGVDELTIFEYRVYGDGHCRV